RSGIYNIYAYSLADEKLFQLTNVVTGAFEPAIAPDSKDLAYIQYHSSGYELHLVKSDDLLWESVEKPEITPSIILPALKNDKVYFPEMQPMNNEENTRSKLAKITSRYDPGYTLKKYSPRNSILPTYWVPYFGIIENNLYLGLSAQAQDYLEFYQIPATIAYSPFYDSLFYSCQLYSYINEPSLSLSWEGETSSYTEFQLTLRFNDSGYTSQGDSGRLFSRNFSIGVQSEYLWANQEPQAELPLKDSTLINSLLLRYAYNDTEKYQWSSSPELGNSYSLSYQYGLPFPDSEATFHKFLFDSRKYFSLPHSHQVVALRLVAGHLSNQENEERQFSLGGSISAQNLSSVNTKNFSLRGFPSSSFAGNNLLLGSLEYRFPLKKPERKIGFHAVSVFLEQVSGTLFLEAGQVWNETLLPSFEDIKISMGGEIVFTLKLRYTEPLLLSLGIGKAISEPLPARFYGRIGLSF
ncbi:MAG TPA: BamA/TamA family outer membrane protein, partial [Atribacterota bacterium]|nr:BamA/TamA family outer membrane protein [Atribacterota bacterium]